MKIKLTDVPKKLIVNIPPPGLAGLDFKEKKRMISEMQEEDPKIIYDTMRPVGDEFWNLIDNKRTIEIIAEHICYQFDLSIGYRHFLKIAEGLYRSKFIDVK